MILYHGSYVVIEKPELKFSREKLDFGRGFYTTPFFEQARKWTERLAQKYGKQIVNIYEIDDEILPKLNILEFPDYSEDWLDFITLCRRGIIQNNEYDIIAGSVANDKVFDTIEEFAMGYRTKEEALTRLRYEKPNWQFCFKSQKVIDEHLKYTGFEVY
jgi:hypothetical protein